jgi:hypothetical protein
MNRNIVTSGVNWYGWKSITGTGNRVYGIIGETTNPTANAKLDRTTNTFFPNNPITGTEIFIRPNKYESGRANVIIYNWGKSPTVQVDLSSVLKIGDNFEFRDAYNFLGTPIITGAYNGVITVPMTGLTVAPAIGFPTPPHTAPEFGVFVVIKK